MSDKEVLGSTCIDGGESDELVAATRAAAPTSEPVAWMFKHRLGHVTFHTPDEYPLAYRDTCIEEVRLYAHPHTLRALSDEQISNRMWEAEWPEVMLSDFVKAKLVNFARCVERGIAAHNGMKLEEE